MLLITTPGGAIQYANPRFCQVTGFSAELLAGTHPDLVDASGLPLEFLADQWQSLKSQGVWRRECQLRLRSGELLWVGISVSGLVEGDGEITHCIWALEDLALHRQAVETLREAKQLAEEAADSKARFLANMSHEIRTPQCHHRPRQPVPRYRHAHPAARLRHQDPRRRHHPARRHQRRPGLLQDRGGQAAARTDHLRP
jgi:PAS domain S-box-containing protein